MPEHPELTVQFPTTSHTFHQIVDTEILMVLSDNLDTLVVEEDEVLDIVQKPLLTEKTVYQIGYTQSMIGNLLAVEFLLLVIHT